MVNNYSFQAGMPINMDEVMERAKGITFSSLLEYTRDNTNICMLHDNSGQMLFSFPILGQAVPFLDVNLLMAKGWSVTVRTAKKEQYTAMSNSYWACHCEVDWVHHKMMTHCPLCSTTSFDGVKMHYIEDFITQMEWEFIVGG